MLCKFVSVLLFPSLRRSSLSPGSGASLGAFFPFSFCHLYSLFSLFSFLHLQGCLQQSPGRQSYLEAQRVLLLSLGYVPAPTLGWSKARVGSTAPHSALSRAPPAAAPGRGRAEPNPGTAGEGQLQGLGCKRALGEVCSEVECY